VAMWDHPATVGCVDSPELDLTYPSLAAYYWTALREGRKNECSDYNTLRTNLTNPLVQMQWMCMTHQIAFALEVLREFARDFYNYVRKNNTEVRTLQYPPACRSC
jgi:hypothetical protein